MQNIFGAQKRSLSFPGKIYLGLIGLLACSDAGSARYNNSNSEDNKLFLDDLSQNNYGDYCVSYMLDAQVVKKPVDIIFVIDNSGSMSDKIEGVVSNININFSQIIDKSGLDYRVIMLTHHGQGSLDVCVEAPLSTIPAGGCKTIGYNPPGINPGKFYHYSTDVGSSDSLCLILRSLIGDKKDDFNLAPNGFIDWLRPEAEKIFVEVTDDNPACSWKNFYIESFNNTSDLGKVKSDALKFDQMLLALAPKQFGTAQDRKYKFYSIIGTQAKNLLIDPDTGYSIHPNSSAFDSFNVQDPVVEETCFTGMGPGLAYQYLSVLTNSLRFPICYPKGFNSIFKDIASGIVSNGVDLCHLQVPKSDTATVDPTSTVIDYYSSGQFKTQFTALLPDETCTSTKNKFQLDEQLGTISLCQDSCKQVMADPSAKLIISAACMEKLR